jgi:hypothetical protein
MVTRHRLLAFLLVAGLVGVVLAFGWAVSNRGALEGTVYAGGGCPGNPPKDVPGYGCSAPVAAANATVVVSTSDGLATSARTDRSGRYLLTLPAATYMVAAWKSAWVEVSSDGIRSDHPARATQFWPVRISSGKTARANLSFPTFAI